MYYHSLLPLALCTAYASPYVSARALYSGPEDLFAFPKHRVTFLNDLPVKNETAHRWLHQGLQGGEREFLGEHWQPDSWRPHTLFKKIAAGDAQHSDLQPEFDADDLSPFHLEHIKMGPNNSFLCLIPPGPEIVSPSPPPLQFDEHATLSHSWSLLQPLSGRCLYYRHMWFTYSYCHNQEIRQFRELPQAHPHLAGGGHEPREDPSWESFTLGRAPAAVQQIKDVAIAEQPINVKLAHGEGPTYLTQRYSDGTLCDKTGKPREVEVQFRCSPSLIDSIAYVREARTCSYVLEVQTPRLCDEPGFMSRTDSQDESLIQCREIVEKPYVAGSPSDSTHLEEASSSNAREVDFDHPHHMGRRKAMFPVPPPVASARDAGGNFKDSSLENVLQKAFQSLLANGELQSMMENQPRIVIEQGDNGDLIIEIVEEIPYDSFDENMDAPAVNEEELDLLTEVLRQAALKHQTEPTSGDEDDEENEDDDYFMRDEL
ncbi:hypothetical protein CONPUDRAFT_47616 [Coniophora puteana RWD-64-598 SS2]|uniref:Protein OS-9 homolog n=1 Tax=Coniophora puteana (strain RWD-64-598) TaxID=741705 RepID=A0A5M3N0X5_CONPW|nr:uncharacterized protein CONPUDRAFT_47616 [Coniophora puteana RWD-64-598 SS2]EIW85028.1 hypothetical protein CONPUDRAFT_47616 [Coniophora puteana RWD-64-598 SS2]